MEKQFIMLEENQKQVENLIFGFTGCCRSDAVDLTMALIDFEKGRISGSKIEGWIRIRETRT